MSVDRVMVNWKWVNDYMEMGWVIDYDKPFVNNDIVWMKKEGI